MTYEHRESSLLMRLLGASYLVAGFVSAGGLFMALWRLPALTSLTSEEVPLQQWGVGLVVMGTSLAYFVFTAAEDFWLAQAFRKDSETEHSHFLLLSVGHGAILVVTMAVLTLGYRARIHSLHLSDVVAALVTVAILNYVLDVVAWWTVRLDERLPARSAWKTRNRWQALLDPFVTVICVCVTVSLIYLEWFVRAGPPLEKTPGTSVPAQTEPGTANPAAPPAGEGNPPPVNDGAPTDNDGAPPDANGGSSTSPAEESSPESPEQANAGTTPTPGNAP